MQAEGRDRADNPFQYAGEYRDPLRGGVDQRARGYHPGLPSFISRDLARNLGCFAGKWDGTGSDRLPTNHCH